MRTCERMEIETVIKVRKSSVEVISDWDVIELQVRLRSSHIPSQCGVFLRRTFASYLK